MLVLQETFELKYFSKSLLQKLLHTDATFALKTQRRILRSL